MKRRGEKRANNREHTFGTGLFCQPGGKQISTSYEPRGAQMKTNFHPFTKFTASFVRLMCCRLLGVSVVVCCAGTRICHPLWWRFRVQIRGLLCKARLTSGITGVKPLRYLALSWSVLCCFHPTEKLKKALLCRYRLFSKRPLEAPTIRTG